MARKIIEDMLPSGGRSIRRISLDSARRRPPDLPPSESPGMPGGSDIPAGGSKRALIRWGAAAVAVVALGSALALLFAETKVTIVPKESRLPIETSLKAFKNPAAGELPFETLMLERSSALAVPATGEEEASVRASGTIVVYNDYGASPQRLIRNTRFQSAEGKIYRIDKSVTVPGKSGSTPGSLEVVVYADEPSAAYNAGLTDFTIPGFKGSPQYAKFYARSKTPMAGGFVGKRQTIDAAARESALESIETKLRSELGAEAAAKKPDGFVLINGAGLMDFEALPDEETPGTVQVRGVVRLHALLFPERELARVIAAATGVSPAEQVPLAFGAGNALTFALNAADTFEPWEKESFSFTLSGLAHLVAVVDTDAFRQDLAGKPLSALTTVRSGYPAIEEVEVSMRPFWKRSFPDDPTDIAILVVSASPTP